MGFVERIGPFKAPKPLPTLISSRFPPKRVSSSREAALGCAQQRTAGTAVTPLT